MSCEVYWGSHGCDKPAGHVEAGDIVHKCGYDDGLSPNLGGACSECIVLLPEDTPEDERGIALNAAVRYALFAVADAVPADREPSPVADADWTMVGWSEWRPSRWYT